MYFNTFKRSKRQEVSASADVEPPVEPEIEPVASEVADSLPDDVIEDTASETEVETVQESSEEIETSETEEEATPDEPSDVILPVANVTDTAQEGEKGMWLKVTKMSERHLMTMIHFLK